MSFITKNIVGTDERITYIARIHWVYVIEGFIWMMILFGIGWGLDYLTSDTVSSLRIPHNEVLDQSIEAIAQYPVPAMIFSFFGALIFLVYFSKMMTSEIAITSERLVYKKGWIMVEVEEIELSEIRAEHIHHGFWGRIFGCGYLYLDSRFVGDIYLPYVSKPYKLLRALHKSRAGRKEKEI
jgi:hypothetical protein